MVLHVKVRHGRVKVGHMHRVNKINTKTAGKLAMHGCGIELESNLGKLRHSLKALSISGKKPKYISF